MTPKPAHTPPTISTVGVTPYQPTVLTVGGALNTVQVLVGATGYGYLIMQNDNNLVAYDSNGNPKVASGKNGGVTTILTEAGVLQQLDSNNNVVWTHPPNAPASGPSNEYTVQVAPDGAVQCHLNNTRVWTWSS